MNTYGATRFKLIENGYAPTSAAAPGSHGHRVADDPAAVLTIPQGQEDCGLADYDKRRVLALTVIVSDKKIRADVLAVLVKHCVGKGPVRVASDGSETHVLRWDGYNEPMSNASGVAVGETDPAVALDAMDRKDPMLPPSSSIIRLDGTWRQGDLLTVPRAKLPTLTDIDALFADIRRALDKHAPPFELPKWKPEGAKGAYGRNEIEPWSANGAVPGTNHPNPWLPNQR